MAKYSTLKCDIENHFHLKAELHIIIVSSLGAIEKETINEIQKIAKCSKNATRLWAKRISIAALRGSYLLFHNLPLYANRYLAPCDIIPSNDNQTNELELHSSLIDDIEEEMPVKPNFEADDSNENCYLESENQDPCDSPTIETNPSDSIVISEAAPSEDSETVWSFD